MASSPLLPPSSLSSASICPFSSSSTWRVYAKLLVVFFRYSTVCRFRDSEWVFFWRTSGCQLTTCPDSCSAALLKQQCDTLLFELTQDLPVGRVRPDAVDNGEGELALGQVLAEALAVRVLVALEVHVVVADLEVDRDQVRERDVVAASVSYLRDNDNSHSRLLRPGHHELDGDTEQTAGF